MKIIKISGAEFDASLDNGEWPEDASSVIETILASMKDSPGGPSETVQIEITNDFEPEEESED